MIRQEHPTEETAVSKNHQKKSTTAKPASDAVAPASLTIAIDELAEQLRKGPLPLAVGVGLRVASY